MSKFKRSKRPLEQRIEAKRDLSRESAIEHTQVRLDGVGEHPAIQAAASPEFATMSNAEAFQVALAIQELVRGQASILSNQKDLSENLSRVEARMRKYDEDARKWDEDRQKFLDDINQRADKLRVTEPSKRGEMVAQVMDEDRRAQEAARALHQTNTLKFKAMIENSPKVKIISPGILETGRIGDQPITRIVPEVIRIKNFEWKLPPGVAVEVPDFVARRFEEIQRGRAELEERQSALSADRNQGAMSEAAEVSREMARINQKYGTTPDQRSA